MHLPIGTHLQGGRYEILRYISSGGFGCTYEARDTKFKSKEKTVAIKEFFVKDFCNRDRVTGNITVATESKIGLVEKMRNKFIEEAEALYDLQHANIVRVTDKFEENNTAYYVMDYIDGKPLSAIIDEKGRLGEKEALGYICQAASALEFVHKHNRLHLDVKPQNIMIDREGKAVLIDFGVSKQYDEVNGENTSTLLGCTPGYAPLEQSGSGLREFSPTTDIYSLGATLYKMVTGATPPVASEVNENGLPALPSNISPAVRRAIEAAMEPRRKDRPQSIAEFLALLSRNGKVQGNCVVSEDTVVPNDNIISASDVEVVAPAPAKKSRLPLIVGLLLVLLLVGAGIFFVTSNGGGNNSETSGIVIPDSVPETPAPEPVAEPTPVPEPVSVVNTDSIVAARLQAYQDSIDAVNAAREEAERIAQEQAAAEQQRLAAEQRAREEAERIAREQQQGISTSQKVDLGLSVCWAGWNVGASSPEGYGYYYALGETTTKTNYTRDSYQYYNGSRYINIGSNISGTQYDVARKQWGGSWRLPTEKEMKELVDYCTWTWTTYKGVEGYKVTGPNGNSIFLPATGYREGTELNYRGSLGLYWSGSLNGSYSNIAYALGFLRDDHNIDNCYREYGYTVRPVSE